MAWLVLCHATRNQKCDTALGVFIFRDFREFRGEYYCLSPHSSNRIDPLGTTSPCVIGSPPTVPLP